MLKKIDQVIRRLNHARIDVTRAFMLQLFGFIFNPLSRFLPMGIAQHNILILRLDDKVGDSVTATGFLRELKAAYPKSKLIVVAGRVTSLIYQNLAFVDEVIVTKKGLITSLKTYFQLHKKTYQFIINTSHILSPRVIFLTSQLKAEKKISFLNKQFSVFSQHAFFNQNEDHVSLRYLNTLKEVGISNVDISYELSVEDEVLNKAQASIQELRQQPSNQIIILNSFAGARLRNLRKELTFEIVKRLLENPNYIILSVGNEGDLRIISEWVREFNNPRWVYFSAAGSLFLNIALLKAADLIVTPDTAWVHMASALKKKIVAIYREDTGLEQNIKIWAPYQTESRILIAPFKAEAPYDINTISAEFVKKAVESLLEKKS